MFRQMHRSLILEIILPSPQPLSRNRERGSSLWATCNPSCNESGLPALTPQAVMPKKTKLRSICASVPPFSFDASLHTFWF